MIALSCALLNAAIGACDDPTFPVRTYPVPEGTKVSVKTDRAEYFLGERIRLQFTVHNAGKEPIAVLAIGATSGLRLHLYAVEVRDAGGKLVPTRGPDPFGGLGYGLLVTARVPPGRSQTFHHRLNQECVIEQPGRYTVGVRCLDWTGTEARPNPVAKTVVRVKLPSAGRARRIVADLASDPAADRFDFSVLAHPVYLGPLKELADDGKEKVVHGIASIPTPAATLELIRLARPGGAVAAIARAALIDRLPPPDVRTARVRFAAGRFWFGLGDYRLSRLAWKPRFAPHVRVLARRLVRSKDDSAVCDGARMLARVGTKTDVSSLSEALGRAAHSGAKGTPSRAIVFDEKPMETLREAARAMAWRGQIPPTAARTVGDAILFAEAVRSDPDFRLEGWLGTYVRILRSPDAVARSVALQCLSASVAEQLTNAAVRD